jgi:hypothetical protein
MAWTFSFLIRFGLKVNGYRTDSLIGATALAALFSFVAQLNLQLVITRLSRLLSCYH